MIFTKAKKVEIDLCKSFNSLEMRWSLLFVIWGTILTKSVYFLEFRTKSYNTKVSTTKSSSCLERSMKEKRVHHKEVENKISV